MELNTNADLFHFAILGLAETRLGNFEKARAHFLKALPYSTFIDTSIQALYGFSEIAWLSGDKTQALEYSALVFEHRGTHFEYKQYAKELLAKLQSEMDIEEYQSAYERGKLLDLETLIKQILAESE